MHLDPLYYKDPKNNLRVWEVWVVGSTIYTQYGQVGGKLQKSRKRAEGKNVGRSNETTDQQQAIVEAQAMWTHKLSRQYSLFPEKAITIPVILPMKLHPYDKHVRKMKYPLYVQPKLDGFRAMATLDDETGETVVFKSRSGREYKLTHLCRELLPFLKAHPDVVLDGEFYLHGRMTFERLASLIKRPRTESEAVEYHIFDCVLPVESTGFRHRFGYLLEQMDPIPRKVKFVSTILAHSKEQLDEIHKRNVEEGYEGSVARNVDGLYRYNYRSYDALKIKDFQDAEFPIVGFERGVGKFENAVIWVCTTREGKEFKAVPVGTFEQRASLLKEAKTYIGKKVTVRYLNLTENGIPRHPVALRIREQE